MLAWIIAIESLVIGFSQIYYSFTRVAKKPFTRLGLGGRAGGASDVTVSSGAMPWAEGDTGGPLFVAEVRETGLVGEDGKGGFPDML